MMTLPWRSLVLRLAFALALLAIPAVIAVLLTPSGERGTEPTSAAFVPENAALYIAINTDPGSAPWRSASALLERLGAADLADQLREGFVLQDAPGEAAVAPLPGSGFAFFLTGLDLETGVFHGGTIMHVRDPAQAERLTLRALPEDAVERHHLGITYHFSENEGAFVRLDDHLVFASDEAALHAVLETRHKRARSLAAAPTFRRLRGELGGEFLAFVYLDPARLAGEAPGLDLFASTGLMGIDSGALAAVVRASDDAFTLTGVAMGDTGLLTPALQPHTSRFAAIVPARTAVFFSTSAIAGVWAALADTIAESDETGAGVLDVALAATGEALGLTSIEDLIAILDGEVAVAVWFSEDGDLGGAVLLVEVADAAVARPALEAFVVLLGGEEAGVAVTVANGYAALGTPDAIEALGEGGTPVLASSERYAAALDAIEAPPGTIIYLDLGSLTSAFSEAMPIDGAAAVDALGAMGAMIVNLVVEDGLMHIGGTLTIEAAD